MPGIPTAKFSVSNLDQWGRLVKSWATGRNYVDTDYADQPPRTCWVNKTWPGEEERSPGPATVDNTDAEGKPLPWCLPEIARHLDRNVDKDFFAMYDQAKLKFEGVVPERDR